MELEPAAAPRVDIGKLPYFNGFPYLATRLASAVYRIRLLPAEWNRMAMYRARPSWPRSLGREQRPGRCIPLLVDQIDVKL